MMKPSQIKSIVQDYFLAGLLILAPLFVVGMVIHWFFGGIIGWIETYPLHWMFEDEPNQLAGIIRFLLICSVIAGIVFLISVIGFLSRLYLGVKTFQWMREAIERIPVFGAIYSSLDQLLKAISSTGGKQFSRVVFVEYPRRGAWAVAFVTGPAKFKGIPPGHLSIFLPTVPNPTSGFHLMVPETEVIESGLRVDEAFKLILSLGVAVPNQMIEAAKEGPRE